MASKNKLFYYPNAKNDMAFVRHYNNKRYGAVHADQYIHDMQNFLVKKQEEGEHSLSVHLETEVFTKDEAETLERNHIYSEHFKQTGKQKTDYTILYHVRSNGRLGILGVYMDGADIRQRFKESWHRSRFELLRDKQPPFLSY